MPTLEEVPADRLNEFLAATRVQNIVALAQHLTGKDPDGEQRFFSPRHIRYLGDRLSAMVLEGSGRFIVSLPRRHGKSHLCSIWLPFFYLLHHPTHQVVLASYNEEKAAEWGASVRDLVERYGAQFGMKMRTDTNSKSDWRLHSGGGMKCVGIGGSLTGIGPHCFPAGTMVETESGPIDIATLARLKCRPRVLSFNHQTGRTEYRHVQATHTSQASDFIRLSTDRGCQLSCTPNHRLFDAGHGYKEADRFSGGETVVCLAPSQEVRDVRHPNRAPANLQAVLFHSEEDYVHAQVQVVRERVSDTRIRVGEETTERVRGPLLQESVLVRPSCDQESQEVSHVWGERHVWEAEDLLRRVQGDRQREASCSEEEEMRAVQEVVPAILHENQVLFKGVQEQSSFDHDDRQGESLDYAGVIRSTDFYQDEAIHSPTRQSQVRGVWTGQQTQALHSSHRRESVEQRHRESCDAVLNVPHEAPQTAPVAKKDTVSVVERVRCESQPVYDIQVEGNNNFFANGVLAHNCMIIDDAVKNDEEAQSQTMRDKTWNWWLSSAYSGIEPNGSCIVIATRWHEDDLIGRLLKQSEEPDSEKWKYFCFPALAIEEDALGRESGDPLWPRRYSTAEYEKKRDEQGKPVKRKESYRDLHVIRKSVGPRVWASLYQQNPVPDGGGIFKREYFRYYEDKGDYYELKVNTQLLRSRKLWKRDCWRVMVADTAQTEKTWSDYTVIQVWDVERKWPGKSDLDRAAVLVSQWRERALTPKVETAMRSMNDRYKPIYVAVEERNNAIEIIQRFRRDGIPVKPIKANTSKVARAANAEIWMAAGMVYFPENESWVADVEAELLRFMPNAAHDDIVDCISHTINLISESDLWSDTNNIRSQVNSYAKNSAYHVFGMGKDLHPGLYPKEESMFAVDPRKQSHRQTAW